MRSGSQARTKGGITGCMIATPAPITIVEPNRIAAFGVAPRAAEPRALSSNPTSIAGTSPKRAINSAPGTAAIANSIGGRLDSQPMPVSDKCRSA